MAKNDKKEKQKIKANDLVIVEKSAFPSLEQNPIDNLDDELLTRVRDLAFFYLLRTPIDEISRLANPSCINMFELSHNPHQGSRDWNKVAFNDGFLCPLGLDCDQFKFVYKRNEVKPNFTNHQLVGNDAGVFNSTVERVVAFVGKGNSGKEDSCIESICRHVRNAFAHGRIAIKRCSGEPYIFFEDGATPRNVDYEGVDKPRGALLEIRMRMLVRLSTLELWHEILVNESESGGVD